MNQYDLMQDSAVNCILCKEHKVKIAHLRCPICLEKFIKGMRIPDKVRIKQLEKELEKALARN